VFPFIFDGTTFHTCARDRDRYWCSTKTNDNGVHVSRGGNWGWCPHNGCDFSNLLRPKHYRNSTRTNKLQDVFAESEVVDPRGRDHHLCLIECAKNFDNCQASKCKDEIQKKVGVGACEERECGEAFTTCRGLCDIAHPCATTPEPIFTSTATTMTTKATTKTGKTQIKIPTAATTPEPTITSTATTMTTKATTKTGLKGIKRNAVDDNKRSLSTWSKKMEFIEGYHLKEKIRAKDEELKNRVKETLASKTTNWEKTLKETEAPSLVTFSVPEYDEKIQKFNDNITLYENTMEELKEDMFRLYDNGAEAQALSAEEEARAIADL